MVLWRQLLRGAAAATIMLAIGAGFTMQSPAIAWNLATPAYYAVDEVPVELIAVDLNGDRAIDLVTMSEAGEVGPSLSLLLNNGSGRFAEEERLFIDRLRHVPHALSAAALSASGSVDLFVAADDVTSFPPRSSLLHFVNQDGSGDFLDPEALLLDGSFPACLISQDMNDDIIPDLVMCHVGPTSAGQITVLASAAGRPLSRIIDVRVGTAPRGAVAGDLDGDGHPDIVVVDDARGSVYALYGTGGAEILTGGMEVAAVDSPAAVAIVSGVGSLPTLLIASSSIGVFELRQTQPRRFLPPRHVTTVAGTRLAIADMNRDSLLDFLLLRPAASTVSTWAGGRTGDFQLASDTAIDVGSVAMVVNDYDFNGLPDLASISSATDRVAVYRQQPAPTFTPTRTPTPLPTPAMAGDADCDGAVTVDDLNAGIEALFWPTCSGGDVNADDAYTAADVTELIAILGAAG